MNWYIPSYQKELDTTAYNLATDANTYLQSGYTATGTLGQSLFTGITPGNPDGSAALTRASSAAAFGNVASWHGLRTPP